MCAEYLNANDKKHHPLSVAEIFGLTPFSERLNEVKLTLFGDSATPKTQFSLSSLRQLRPRISFPLWSGRPVHGRRVPISNLFNHRQTSPLTGWSVEVTQVEDFRGKSLTYNSHNGTDLAVPPGTRVVAPADGVVLRASSEFNRGGLKIFLDHGHGLFTSCNHLARSLVRVGDIVQRGQPIALSGYSGIDGLITFPWGIPHVHFNVWLNGQYVDPFSRHGETSLWLHHNEPRTYRPRVDGHTNEAFSPTFWNEDAIVQGLSDCIHDATVRAIKEKATVAERAASLLFYANYYPSRFKSSYTNFGLVPSRLYAKSFERKPCLTLPFSCDDFDSISFIDE